MSGHSKWKTIKHKKAATDAKRSKEFSKLIKEITVAARTGGGDPSANSRLRTLLDKARMINMPNENAIRAIKKGTGELPGVSYEEFMYEGYGPGGIAVLVETLTDNKNKAVAQLRHAFTKNGGNLAESGAVSWMFERLGVIRIEDTDLNEDELLEKLLDYDIKDIIKDDSSYLIMCNMKSLEKVKQALKRENLNITEADVEWVAKNPHQLDKKNEGKAIDFLQAIEELDDVQNVYTNLG
ncbi:unnamed protein product [marine sediment metagenome]|uniref:Transcriptional regulatory protein n=1 Tax=marine sediment metagenome TaxID=412755 RepID=X0RWU9_9ZZZZ